MTSRERRQDWNADLFLEIDPQFLPDKPRCIIEIEDLFIKLVLPDFLVSGTTSWHHNHSPHHLFNHP
jgi:hypothetical protein